jgi:membrane-bound serine protease (ClpP class)
VAELFTPGFGGFGVTGLLALLASLILRVTLDPTDNPVAHFFLLFAFEIIIILVLAVFFFIALKKGWLNKTALIENKSAVPVGLTDGTADYMFLVGKTGSAITVLRPAGIAVIDGKRYDVVAEGEFIDAEAELIVDSVEGGRIVVKRA